MNTTPSCERHAFADADWRVEFGSRSDTELRDGAAGALRVAARDPHGQGKRHPPVRTRGAELELERLHVEELARLLGRAAELRWARSASSNPSEALAARLQSELAAWRAALEDELWAARLDGARYSIALRELLAACALDPSQWPAAIVLARAAASLHPSARRRASLARQARRDGDVVVARAENRAALACAPGPRLRSVIELGLCELERCSPLSPRQLERAQN